MKTGDARNKSILILGRIRGIKSFGGFCLDKVVKVSSAKLENGLPSFARFLNNTCATKMSKYLPKIPPLKKKKMQVVHI